ncbi:MAG TPA: hypothetical protein VFF28_02445 [Candidatus Nanoarchaeia archaeon]|nr:hypothetical protein [Candidatus Nanoarchaeia archaeon]
MKKIIIILAAVAVLTVSILSACYYDDEYIDKDVDNGVQQDNGIEEVVDWQASDEGQGSGYSVTPEDDDIIGIDEKDDTQNVETKIGDIYGGDKEDDQQIIESKVVDVYEENLTSQIYNENRTGETGNDTIITENLTSSAENKNPNRAKGQGIFSVVNTLNVASHDNNPVTQVSGVFTTNKTDSNDIYLVPYVGDFDGNIDSDWYHFYHKLIKWHEETGIKTGISFYPSSLDNTEFKDIIAKASGPNMELIMKSEASYKGKRLAEMDKDEAKEAIGALLDKCKEKLGIIPTTYNQELAEFTPEIRDAVRELGFKMYLEHYESDYGYVDMTPDFDITQYSVSFTKNGLAGPENEFKTADDMISEIMSYEHEMMITIDGKRLIPLLVHQQDFRASEESDELNEKKWKTYTETLTKASKDPRIRILLPSEVYGMRHK